MNPLIEITAPKFSRITDWLGIWAIEETAGTHLANLCQRADLFAHVESTPERRSDSSYSVVKAGKENVAVITMTGVLMKSVPSMQSGTSTVDARRAIRKAAADPEVTAILLAIDSPGGSVSGTFDLAADVKAAGKVKPVWAQIEDCGASAAYAIASQADKIFANNASAEVGCIGTVMAVYDLSGQAEKAGVRTLVFKTGPLKGAGIPGAAITEEQQQHFQQRVDDAQQSFDVAVQKGRGLTDKQLESVKTGGVFGATEALAKKLIDGIQSFDTTISQLAAHARRDPRTNSRAAGPVQRSLTVNETELNAVVDTKAIAEATTKAVREAAALEQTRIAAINAECAGLPEIAAKAIAEGWTPEKAENAALKAKLANNVRTADGPTLLFNRQEFAPGVTATLAIEAALCLTAGVPNLEKRYRPEVLDAADKHYKRVGLQQIIMMAAAQNGHQFHVGEKITAQNIRGVLKDAFAGGGERQAAGGFSTNSLSGILGNVANGEIRSGYEEGDQTWKEISQVKSANNFYQITSYRLLDNMEYEKVAPSGAIKHGTLSEESYTRQIATYAKMFQLTRQDIINDDLGAFSDLRTRLGRGSAKKLSNLFWSTFMDNSTFFTAARGNYVTGATTNLGTDGVGMGLGVTAFRKLKSPTADGAKRVGGRPDRILVPPELETTADLLYMARNETAVKAADVNTHAGKYRPVVVDWLSDTDFTGNSSTAWYAFRDPADLPAMIVSFLNGNQTPTVESTEADFDTLGVQFRGYHDFGVDFAEYLAGIKVKGAA